MNKSESIKNLAEALAKAQAEMPAAHMNAVNPFLGNRFADLGSIISTAQPILKKYGLAVSQFPISGNGEVGITTILMHESGEWLEMAISLPLADEKGKSLAQVAGSIITYLRRYSLSSVLNMYADEDVDGEEQQDKKQGARKTRPKQKSTPRNKNLSRWQTFLDKNDLTEKEALSALGTEVIDWMKANPGKTEQNAYDEILAITGKG